MPEIKNTFTQGKMNKDLDERLVPNGQYRDAMNVQLSTSDGSDIGTVQNILGNKSIENVVDISDAKCVGSISDEGKNRLFWFIKGNSVDAIIEYSIDTGVSAVLVDTKANTSESVLKFPNNIITGINVIDDLLLWTDGVSEPKKINIERCKLGNSMLTVLSSASHTKLVVGGVIVTDDNGDEVDLAEEHITSIKKNPIRPLSIIAKEAEVDDGTGKLLGKTPLFEKIFPRFSYRYKYEDGEYSAYAPFTDVVFKSLWGEDPAENFYNVNNAYGTKEPYNNAMRNMLKSVELKDFISPSIPKDVVQVDLLYKQENSNVIYILEVIDSESEEWNRSGINFNSAYKGSFTVTSENIYAALPENQLLRPWDNIPKSAIAQEVTGNRVVYGNYKQSYNVPTTPIVVAGFKLKGQSSELGGLPSVKSQRDYQVGVVYGDKYGRETPVFTTESASLTVPWGQGDPNSLSTQQLISDITTAHPEWASYYKFFVKETSGEYYNLVMDAIYQPTKEDLLKEDHVWLSFASSDRNKVSKEDYMILKKRVGIDSAVILENKYRILDVKNEAPDSIKYKYLNLGEMSNVSGELNTDIFPASELRPATGKNFIRISQTNWHNPPTSTQTPGMSLIPDKDLYISFYRETGSDTTRSDKFKISAIRLSNGNLYEIHLENPLPDDFNSDYHASATSANELHADTSVIIERKIKKDLESFSGRFFVKVFKDGVIEQLRDSSEAAINFSTKAQQEIHWHADTPNTVGYNPDNGLINNESYTVGDLDLNDRTITVAGISQNVTDNETGWEKILTEVESNRFFIDNMYMASAQQHRDGGKPNPGYARLSGHTWYGGQPGTVDDIMYGSVDNDNFTTFGPNEIPYHELTDPGNFPGYHHHQALDASGFSNNPYYKKMAFPLNSPAKHDIVLNSPGSSGENMINGIPGITTLGDAHTSSTGIRRWRQDIFSNDLTQLDYGNSPSDNGKKVIHLSFLAPGSDLHDGTWTSLTDTEDVSISLQGIHGGGVFVSEDGADFVVCEEPRSAPNNSNIGKARNIQSIVYNFVDGQEPSPTPNYNVYGYDPNYETKHEEQWKPELSGGTLNSSVEKFISAITTPGQNFRFLNDDSNAVYKIQKVKQKRIYNHTPWRRMYKSDLAGGITAKGDSVEEYAIAWKQDPTNTGKKTAFEEAVVRFGNKNNRRVCYIIHLDETQSVFPASGGIDPRPSAQTNTNGKFNSKDSHFLQLVNKDFSLSNGDTSENPAIWETEPKDNVDLDIYYEAGQAYPTTVTEKNIELFAPVGSVVSFPEDTRPFNGIDNSGSAQIITGPVKVSDWSGVANSTSLELVLNEGVNQYYDNNGAGESINYVGIKIRFTRSDGGYTTATVSDVGTVAVPGFIRVLIVEFDSTETGLSWYNCFSFGNGIESNRIRDDFNAMTLSNGVKASTTLDSKYKEEHRKNGLIYSGLYNSTNGVNDLNQFIMAEKITKDLNPTYGSIQKLFSRRISLIAFCEDRVVAITANKNALYNADGNPQIVASNAVLGDANPFVGDYGISKNPESFAKDSYRAYFTDKQRGAVLRLSMDGLTPISDAGMHDYFRDNLKTAAKLIGIYDDHKEDYNLTLTNFLPENVIVNGLINEGTGGSTESFDTTEIVIDGGFSNGTNVTLPSTPANIANNSDLDSSTIITNYPEITEGSLQAEQEEKVAYNWSFASPTTPNTIIYHTIEDTNYGDFFSVPVGETTDKASAAMWQGYIGSGQGFYGTNSSDRPYLKNADSSGSGAVKIWAKAQNLDSDLVDPEVSGLNNTNTTTSSNPNYFATAIDSTVFHKEEYKVTFTVQNYLSPADATHYTQTGGSSADNYIDLEIALWADQGGSAGKISNFHSDGTTPYFANGIETVSTAEDYSAGWLTSNTYTFDDVPLTSSKTFSFHFMLEGEEGVEINTLTDPSNNMLLGPIANFFNIHFKNSKSDLSRNSVIIKELKIEKTRKVINPGNNFSQFLVPAEPPADVLAWAEVEHVAFSDWSGTSNIILNDFAIDKYGSDTGSGTTVTYDTYDYSTGTATGNTGTYIDGTPNGITTYNEYVDDTYTEDGSLEVNASNDYLTQDITSNPLVINNWYEVRLIGVIGSSDGILVDDALDPNNFPTGFTSGDTLPGHLGKIDNGSGNKVIFDDQGNNERIARWQQKNTGGDLDTLKILLTNFNGTIDRIEFAEIYDTVNGVGKVTGGTVDDWTINNPNSTTYHYYSPRKKVYYHGNSVKWGYDSTWRDATPTGFVDVGGEDNNYALQAVSIPVTNDGYELRFQTMLFDAGQGPGVNTGSLSGYVTGGFENVDSGHTYGFEFDGIEQGGYYKVTGNLDGTTTPTIERVLSDYITPAGSTGSLTVGIKDFAGPGHADKVLFRPTSGSFFKGRLANVSLKDVTNYFTTTNAESWLFDGFDPNFEDYIVFDDVNENILFTDAPNTVSLQQNIARNFTTGSIVQLKFDAIGITSGSISGYFYNNEGEGFTFGPISADTNFDSEDNLNNRITIGNSTVTGGELLNTFVIYVDTEYFSGTLDNFELYRIYPEFVPSTVTYSEDVKGWVSFKSFMPESGVSLSKEHYTFKDGSLYQHNFEDVDRNTFYNEFIESSITAVLNAEPSTMKIYNTLNYEGTQSKINLHTTKDVFDADGNTVTLSNVEMYNLNAKDGWYVGSITTDKQSGSIKEFVEKEGKWFNYIKGTGITDTTLPSTADLSFQGLGMVEITTTL